MFSLSRSTGLLRLICTKAARRSAPQACVWHARTLTRIPCQATSPLVSVRALTRTLSSSINGPEVNLQPSSILGSASDLLDMWDSSIASSSPQEVASMLATLLACHYSNLTSTPWLQSNIHIAYIQLILDGSLEQSMAILHQHPAWERLLTRVDECYMGMTNLELVQSLQALLYTGIKPTMDVAVKLYCASKACLHEADLLVVEAMAHLYKIYGRDFGMHQSIIRRILTIVDDPDKVWTAHDVHRLSNTTTVVLFSPSKQSSEKLFDKVNSLLQKPGMLVDPSHLASHIRFLAKVFVSDIAAKKKLLCRKSIQLCMEKAMELQQDMQQDHIAEICHSLHKSRCYTNQIAAVMQGRALELLEDTHKLSGITNLCYSLNKRCSPEVRRLFETKLFSELSHADIDLVILSNVADILMEINTSNRDLHFTFQRLVAKHCTNLVNYISRLHRVVKYFFVLRQRSHYLIDQESENHVRDILLAEFENRSSLKYSNASTLSLFLLPSLTKAVPHNLQAKLLDAIPRLRYPDLYKLTLALNSKNTKYSRSPTLRKQMYELERCLHASIGEKIDDVPNVDYLYQLTLGLVVHNRNRDPNLSTKILHAHRKFTKNLPDISWNKIIQMYCGMKFYMPEMMEDFVDYVISHESSLTDESIELCVAICACTGYTPERFSELLPMALQLFSRYKRQGSYHEQLLLLKHLTLLSCFPEAELGDFFQLDTIEEIDSFMEDQSHKRKEVESLMFELNRSVLLECPQLDVPWFHEEYGQLSTQPHQSDYGGSSSRHQSHFAAEVGQALSEALGGGKHLRKQPHSPYFHMLDFDCILNDKNKPVICGDFDVPIQKNWTRVAILAQPETNFCYNSKHLTGMEQQKLRHLQIMDYKVVQVPHYEWYSMAMGDWQAKVDYMQQKLFH